MANDAEHFAPESAAVAFDSCPLASVGDVLAGEAPGDDVNPFKVVGSPTSVPSVPASHSPFVRFIDSTAVSDVGVLPSTGEVPGKHFAAVGFDFNLPVRFDSCPLKPKIKPSNPCE